MTTVYKVKKNQSCIKSMSDSRRLMTLSLRCLV